MKKTTIYIDIDDDIAGIAEKISNAEQKIVALVLPKRPSVLQGSVNMNLLKRTGEESSKNLVLITADDQVLRLAGQVGVHVSQSLQSKPYIPTTLADTSPSIEEVSDEAGESSDMAQPDVYIDNKKVDLKTPIGVLAGVEQDDEIDLTNDDGADADKQEDTTNQKDEKTKSTKKISVPNFNSFRVKTGLGLLAVVALVFGLMWAFAVAPKASITLSTEKSDVNSKITVTANKALTAVDAEKGLVPAVRKEDKQKLSGTFAATGKRDVGSKATGTVTVKNCDGLSPITIPAGTGVSRGALTFITQSAITLPGAGASGGQVICSSGVDIKVSANQSGEEYNLASGNFSVATDFVVSANGGPMGGGTTKIVKVVTAEDIEAAKAKVLEKAADNVKGKVTTLLSSDGLVPIADTFVSEVGAPLSSIAVDSEASTDATLSIEITSSMLGIKRTDIDPLLTKDLTKKIVAGSQKISSTGSDKAVIAVTERPSADVVKLTVAVTGKVGPNIDQEKLKKDIAGKKAGEAKQFLEAKPGVARADIRLSPFWVFSVPKNSKKIIITVNE